jgi:hypothetical protein
MRRKYYSCKLLQFRSCNSWLYVGLAPGPNSTTASYVQCQRCENLQLN